MRPVRMRCSNVLIFIIFLISIFSFFIYQTFFRRSSDSTILKANIRFIDDYEYDDDAYRQDNDPIRTKLEWDRFIKTNNYVQIGDVWNKCGKIRYWDMA